METLHVLFKGKAYAFSLPQGADTTLAQVQQLLADELHVPQDAQRLFQKKKKIDTSDAASSYTRLFADVCDDTREAKLYVMAGASISQIDRMKQTQESVEAEQRKRANRRVVSIAKRNEMVTIRDAVSTDYRFHAIEEFPNFSDRHRAREILERLANDRGILAVMDKHKWTVGTLAEMHPDGKVGVDPVCVLGLNQNKGQKILLRLRTDDLLGFRKYLSVKKVLFHELTHNVHSEHDSKFYTLMRQVEKECGELDWTNTGGAAVGGSSGIAIIEDDDDDGSTGSRSGGGHKLGGGTSTSRLLLDQETSRTEKPMHPQLVPAVTSASIPGPTAADDATEEKSPVPITTSHSESVETETRPPVDVEMETPPSTQQEDEKEAAPEAEIEIPVIPQPPVETPSLDFEMEEAEKTPGYQPSDREQRILHAIRQLRTRYSGESVAKAVSLLHKILSNIVQHPSEEKFRSIRKANRVFESQVSRFPECLEFLQAVGFEDQSEKYVLVRQDPVLLWVGRSTLEPMLPSAA